MGEYYYCINGNLHTEVEKEETPERGHIIFDCQRESDIGRLIRLLDDEKKTVVEINPENWDSAQDLIYKIKDRKEHIVAGRKYVASKILQVLEEKYPQLKGYEGSKNLETFEKGQDGLKSYEEKKSSMWDIDDVEDILAIEEINIDRIHFVMRHVSSPVLFNALTILLSDDTPFKVSMYSETTFPLEDPDSKEKEWLTNSYSYTYFLQGREGHPSQRKEDLSKNQKKKKHEKV